MKKFTSKIILTLLGIILLVCIAAHLKRPSQEIGIVLLETTKIAPAGSYIRKAVQISSINKDVFEIPGTAVPIKFKVISEVMELQKSDSRSDFNCICGVSDLKTQEKCIYDCEQKIRTKTPPIYKLSSINIKGCIVSGTTTYDQEAKKLFVNFSEIDCKNEAIGKVAIKGYAVNADGRAGLVQKLTIKFQQ